MDDHDDLEATWAEFLDVHMAAVALVERKHWGPVRRTRALGSLSLAPDDWRLVALQLADWLAVEMGPSADAVADWADRRRQDALDAYSQARDERIRGWLPGASTGSAADEKTAG